jgi:hypothetical protein
MQGNAIAFHPQCALDLAARLTRDALNAIFIADGQNPLSGIAERYRPK